MAESWLIGSDSACDLVVDRPAVSARHCRLTSVGDASYLLEDLGSTNGTFVDGRRITAPWRVSRENVVTLGQLQPMPWPGERPAPASRVLRIGREPDNDLVVNLPTVSGYHARVAWSDRPGEAEVEDLGSSNGTAVGSPDRKAERAIVTANDTIYLGTYPLPAARALEALGPQPVEMDHSIEPVPAPAPGAFVQAVPLEESFRQVVAEEWRAVWSPAWKPGLFLVLGALAGVLAVTSAGFDSRSLGDPVEWNHATRSLAALLSRLGLAAVGLGLAIGAGAGAGLATPAGPRRWLGRAAAAVVLGLAACLLEWGTSRALLGADAGGPAMLRLLWLGSSAGLMLGLIVAAVAPRPAAAWAAVAVLVLPLWALGGESASWARLPAWAKGAAALSPSRWTFEGLLLIVAERTPAPAGTSGDLAEPYFPAETERTGPRAVTLALGAMLLGWGALAAFIAAAPPAPGAGRPAP